MNTKAALQTAQRDHACAFAASGNALRVAQAAEPSSQHADPTCGVAERAPPELASAILAGEEMMPSCYHVRPGMTPLREFLRIPLCSDLPDRLEVTSRSGLTGAIRQDRRDQGREEAHQGHGRTDHEDRAEMRKTWDLTLWVLWGGI